MTERFEQFTLAISQISRCWHKLASEEMEKYGLKGSHCIYLIVMYKYPDGITSPQLCELCGKDKSDASRMLAIMEQKGLITKEGIHQNRYGGTFKLTPEGMHAAQQVRQRASRAVEEAGMDITDAERNTFYKVLDSIVQNLKKLTKDGIPE